MPPQDIADKVGRSRRSVMGLLRSSKNDDASSGKSSGEASSLFEGAIIEMVYLVTMLTSLSPGLYTRPLHFFAEAL